MKKALRKTNKNKLQLKYLPKNLLLIGLISTFALIGAIMLTNSRAVTVPDEFNTGVPSGVVLKTMDEKYNGGRSTNRPSWYTINSDGRVTIKTGGSSVSSPRIIDSVYIPHGLTVQGRFIKIKNSLISSGRSSYNYPPNPLRQSECNASLAGSATLLISRDLTTLSEAENSLIVEKSTIKVRTDNYLNGVSADNVNGSLVYYNNDGPSVYLNVIQGRNATFTESNIYGGVDGVGVFGGGFKLVKSYIHDVFKWPISPGHGCDEPTHSDGIQVHNSGAKLIISETTLSPNPLPITVNYINSSGKTISYSPKNATGLQTNSNSKANINISNSYFKYGTCSINFADNTNTVYIRYNTFNGYTGDEAIATSKFCAINNTFGKYTFTNNKWWDNTPVNVGFNNN